MTDITREEAMMRAERRPTMASESVMPVFTMPTAPHSYPPQEPLLIRDSRGINVGTVQPFIDNGFTARLGLTRPTVQDIHGYIINREAMMDVDIEMILDRCQQGIQRHGFDVDLRHEAMQLESHNATWTSIHFFDGDYSARFMGGEALDMTTAQVTPRSLRTFMAVCGDPIEYLQGHLELIRIHNDTVRKFGELAAARAVQKGWCSDFDEIMNDIRQRFHNVTTVPDFGVRAQEFETMIRIGIVVPYTGRANNREEHERNAQSYLTPDMMHRAIEAGNWDIIEVEAL